MPASSVCVGLHSKSGLHIKRGPQRVNLANGWTTFMIPESSGSEDEETMVQAPISREHVKKPYLHVGDTFIGKSRAEAILALRKSDEDTDTDVGRCRWQLLKPSC